MGIFQSLIPQVAALCPNGRLPDSYMVIDLETSGLNYGQKPDEPIRTIAQFGCAHVRDRRLVDVDGFYIWQPPGTMTKGATDCNRITDELLGEKGIPPDKCYPAIMQLLASAYDEGLMFVGHNLVGFDAKLLRADLQQRGYTYQIPGERMLDTGLLYKAAQMRSAPTSGETLFQYLTRISDTRSKVRWKLELAVKSLELDKRFGLNMEEAHDAKFDCEMTYYLLEELRRLAGLA